MALPDNEKIAELLERLRTGCQDSYTALFHLYYKDLVLFAGTFIQDQDVCEDIVQNIFVRLWNEHDHLSISASLKSYLLSATRNGCVDYIRHQEVHRQYADSFFLESGLTTQEAEKYLLYFELQKELKRAIDRLNDLQRKCFILSRIHGMKYSDIADLLQISLRTVELKIAQAIKLLKEYLKEYFYLFLPYILSNLL